MTGRILTLYANLFGRPRFFRLNRFLHALSLRGMGIFNYESDRLSGETTFTERLARLWRQPVVLDVGANQGRYSARVKALCPQARVIAFEPHPKTFQALKRVADASGFEALNVALGEAAGRAPLFDYSDSGGSEHASLYQDVITDVHGASGASAGEVAISSLDTYVADSGLTHIDLLKIDTEGHEMKVLLGARNTLSSQMVDVIQFEFNEMNVVSRAFMKDFIELLPNYRLFRLLTRGVVPLSPYRASNCEIFAFQNIIAIRDAMVDGVVRTLNGKSPA